MKRYSVNLSFVINFDAKDKSEAKSMMQKLITSVETSPLLEANAVARGTIVKVDQLKF